MDRMAQNGTATFASPDDFRAAIGAANVNLVVTRGGDFFGRLTWLSLTHIHVLRGSEHLPRIAFIELPAHHVFISFPTSDASSFSYGSVGLQFGDFVFHSLGERIHQRFDGAGQWGLISLPPEQLAACAKALTGVAITSPSEGRVLRPSPGDAKRLLRFHSKACGLAESRQRLISNPEVGRALEQELLHALVHCLGADDACNSRRRRRHTDIMVRFETALSERGDLQLNVPSLCKTISVPERTLRECCKEFLGMSPTRYQLLRRLNLARSALRRADPETTSVAEIARNLHFLELGRFAVAYRAVFGEMPSATLRRSNEKRPHSRKSAEIA
jgi:AraC-like DNA-binding protein